MRLRNIRLGVLLLVMAVSSAATADNNSWFEFSQAVKVSWLLKVKSAVVNHVQAGSAAEQAGIQVGDAITAVGGCAIPGCPSSKARQLMDVPVGQSQVFRLQRPGGEVFEVELTAVEWPG